MCPVARACGGPGEGEGGRSEGGEELAVLEVVDAGDADVIGGGGGDCHRARHGLAGGG